MLIHKEHRQRVGNYRCAICLLYVSTKVELCNSCELSKEKWAKSKGSFTELELIVWAAKRTRKVMKDKIEVAHDANWQLARS
jgi:hypothetical protein